MKDSDDCQSTRERTLRGARLLLPFSPCMSHFRFTLFFTRPAYRRGRYALVLVMPARLHNAISGILAGRILGFGIATFLLWHLPAHPVMFLVLFLVVFTDGLLSTWHTSCLVTPLFTAACHDVPIPLISLWLLVFVVWFCVSCCCVCFGFCFVCGCVLVFFFASVEQHHTALAQRAQEASYSIGFTCSN